MSKVITHTTNGKGLRIALVVARFNEFITSRLLTGCLDQLHQLGVYKKDITVVWVPGAFEIPVVAQKFAKKKTIDAVVCLGAVIKGETDHYQLVAENAAKGIMEASLNTGKPVIFEVLATETIELANRRSEEKGINKGQDAAIAAVEMARLLSKI